MAKLNLTGPIVRLIGSVATGLALGAAATHLLHTRGRLTQVGLSAKAEADAAAEAEEDQGPLSPEGHEARDPGRGRSAHRPHHIPLKGWLDILWRWAGSYFGDRVGFVAGGVTFFIVLALFPTFGAFVTVYGLFADPAEAWARLQFLYSFFPPSVAEFLGGQMQRLALNSSGELTFTLVWTLLLSLWAANNGVKTLFYGLNVAYHEVEKRNLVRYNLICFVFTLSGLAAVLLTSLLVVGVPLALGLLGLAEEWADLAPLRWIPLLLFYVTALTLIYRYGPCRAHARWRWLTPGAVLAALASLGVSGVFSWYLQTFVRTDSYGPLAAVMGFLLWTWLSVQVILMGAELNAEIEHQTAVDTTTGPPEPLGRRGAVMADTVGPRRGSPAALAFTLKHAERLASRVRGRRTSA